MQKGKAVLTVTIGFLSLLLTCVMFMQFKVVNKTDIAELESMRDEELKEKLAEWKDKYNETHTKLIENENKIEEYRETSENSEESSKLVKKELDEANIVLGITDVTGNGIQITLKDTSEKEYTSLDLLNLVNELKAAGAEAISINGERIINLTDIVDISTKYILVNSNRVSSPYTVLAIGDESYLKSALNIKNGYVDLRKKEGFSIEVQEKKNIQISKYNKDIELKYIDL